MQESIEFAKQAIRNRVPVQHVVLNAAKVVMLQTDTRLRRIITGCGLVNADGQSIVWAARFLGHRIPERVAGVDLMFRLLESSAAEGYRVYLLGAKEEVLQKAEAVLRARYPALRIVGRHHGYFKPDEERRLVEEIKASQADILFVGISSPFKEYWLSEHLSELGVPFCMGVGGSFDLIAGLTRRAPAWMQRCGLEWLFRLSQEPRRMLKRYLVGNTKFILLVLGEKIRLLHGKKKTRDYPGICR